MQNKEMIMSKLKGIIAPFTTPFSQDGSIDLSLVKPQVDWLIENGVHGLAAGGSTGEGHVLNKDEYISLMEKTSEALASRVPLVAGIIANSTDEVIARGKSVKALNVAALQITPPSYLFRPDDDAMVKHFQEIHEECQIPILIYNVVPWCYLSPDLLLRIMDEVPGVLGVKQSAGDMKLFADLIRRAKPENMSFSAVDALLYLSYQLGAPGSIAAILTAAPGPSVKLWNAVIEQDWTKARDLHERLMPLWDAIGLDNMPSLCKYAQKLQGLETGFARRPTSPATEKQKEVVKSALKHLDLIK